MNEHNQTADPNIAPPVAMLRIISGFWVSRAIYIADKLGIADLVQDQPKTAIELAEATGTHARSLYRVLRALASAGVFAEDGNGRFALTPLTASIFRLQASRIHRTFYKHGISVKIRDLCAASHKPQIFTGTKRE